MGIKGEAIEWFTTLCLEKKMLTELRLDIIRATPTADKDYWPVVAVDASVWVRAALGNPRDDSIVLSQYHATPLVPVTAVSEYFMKRINLLKKHKFHVVLVFDGQRNPLKSQENDIRKSKADRDTLIQKLSDMYNNPESHTMDKVTEIRKQLMSPRKDIFYEVIHAAKKNKINVVGAPYETDTQIVALQGQGIIDAAISTDSDFTAMGVRFVVSDMTLKGKVEVRSYHRLTTQVLPKMFDVKEPVVGDDLNFLAQMLGNDNLPKGLRNSGKADVINRMKVYLRKPSTEEKKQYIHNYITNHDTPTQCRRSLHYWEHGPAYKVIPNNLVETPKKAFFSDEYTVMMCSMSLDEEPADEILGFIPEDKLREGHEQQLHQPTHDEFFRCYSWSRDGKPFEPLPTKFNNSGQEVLHIAIIDFDDKPNGTPVQFVPSRNLEWYLECRGVPSPSLKDRQQIVDMVTMCRTYNIHPLPSYVMWKEFRCMISPKPPKFLKRANTTSLVYLFSQACRFQSICFSENCALSPPVRNAG